MGQAASEQGRHRDLGEKPEHTAGSEMGGAGVVMGGGGREGCLEKVGPVRSIKKEMHWKSMPFQMLTSPKDILFLNRLEYPILKKKKKNEHHTDLRLWGDTFLQF